MWAGEVVLMVAGAVLTCRFVFFLALIVFWWRRRDVFGGREVQLQRDEIKEQLRLMFPRRNDAMIIVGAALSFALFSTHLPRLASRRAPGGDG
jgi:hypothetical protein